MATSHWTESSSFERRVHDRRAIQATSHSKIGIGLSILLLGLCVWQWRAFVYGPVWLVRHYAADHGDVYLGRTNGVSNRELTQRARVFLGDINRLDASGNITPDDLKQLGVMVDLDWFKAHRPERVTFNPFVTPGEFVVSWTYAPGCEQTLSATSRTGSHWQDNRGFLCTPASMLSVFMSPDFRLNTIRIDPLLPG
jgi:hypothetical protein